MKNKSSTLMKAASAALALALSGSLITAAAQTPSFPNRPINLIVPNPPGGLVDGSARIVSDALAKVIGQSVVVNNQPGGSGNVAYGNVAKAAPDGYTLLTSYSAYHVGYPHMNPKLPWAQRDFVPVALVTVATNVIAVHPSIQANTLPEFIAYVKKNPGKLSYASQGNGSLSHMGTEMFKQRNGISVVHIPYRGSGAAITDVLSGQVQVFITTPPSVMQHIQAGKLKGLAVAGPTRHSGIPNVPTTAEAGLKGFELEAWVGIFAPAATPPDVVAKLSASIKAAMETLETKTRAQTAGIEIRYRDSAALEALVKTETEFWGKVITSSKITMD